MRDISFSTSLIHFNGWQPGHCLSYSDGAQRWNAFVPICFVLALSSSAQISTRIQKISHILTVCVGTQYHTKNCCESWLLQIHDHFCVWRMIRVYVQCVSLCVHVTSQLYMYNHHFKKKKKKKKKALTGHPRRSLSHCQAAPSLLLLSPSLEVAHQKRGEAGTGDLSLQLEVPLQAPVTVLPPPDTLKNNRDTCLRKKQQLNPRKIT